jgi:hypothetical protein
MQNDLNENLEKKIRCEANETKKRELTFKFGGGTMSRDSLLSSSYLQLWLAGVLHSIKLWLCPIMLDKV